MKAGSSSKAASRNGSSEILEADSVRAVKEDATSIYPDATNTIPTAEASSSALLPP